MRVTRWRSAQDGFLDFSPYPFFSFCTVGLARRFDGNPGRGSKSQRLAHDDERQACSESTAKASPGRFLYVRNSINSGYLVPDAPGEQRRGRKEGDVESGRQ